MAFTEAQKASIRLYLGHNRDSTVDSVLEERLLDRTASEETLVVSILAKLDALNSAVAKVGVSTGIKAIRPDLEFFESGSKGADVSLSATELVKQLETIFGVHAGVNAFGNRTLGGGAIPLG